jgi:hypothetical protein
MKANFSLELLNNLLDSPPRISDPLWLGLSCIYIRISEGIEDDPLEIGRISSGNDITVSRVQLTHPMRLMHIGGSIQHRPLESLLAVLKILPLV